jgi:hypothetical protein
MNNLPLASIGARIVHFRHDPFKHQRFRHMYADRLAVAGLAEIAGKRLFADNVLAGPNGRDDHLGVQSRWRANIDDVDRRVG